MAPAPDRAAYVRRRFDLANPVEPGCPLCWANNLLKGGRVLFEGGTFYVYVSEAEDGTLTKCFIAPKKHYPSMAGLPPTWGEEFGELYGLLLRTYSIQSHNGYWNEGYAAGQRVEGHWHVHIVEAPSEGTPAYGKGLALLRHEFNELSS